MPRSPARSWAGAAAPRTPHTAWAAAADSCLEKPRPDLDFAAASRTGRAYPIRSRSVRLLAAVLSSVRQLGSWRPGRRCGEIATSRRDAICPQAGLGAGQRLRGLADTERRDDFEHADDD